MDALWGLETIYLCSSGSSWSVSLDLSFFMFCEEAAFVYLEGASGPLCSAMLHRVDRKLLQAGNHRPEYLSSLCNNSGDAGTFNLGLQQSADGTGLNSSGENALGAVWVLILPPGCRLDVQLLPSVSSFFHKQQRHHFVIGNVRKCMGGGV